MLDMNLDPSGIEKALVRIAEALERISPPFLPGELKKRVPKPAGVIKYGGDETRCVREELESLVPQGTSKKESRRLVQQMLEELASQMDTENR